MCDNHGVHVGRGVCVVPLSLVLVAAAWGSIGATSMSAASAAPATELGVRVRLIVAHDLPASTQATLTREAETIWRRAGVQLEWLTPTDDPSDTRPVLRVLVGRLLATTRPGDAWPVGELLPSQEGDRLAIASITAAERVLATAGREEPDALAAHRLGLVLGRTIAHEIGHYLFGTASHARRGLMRAQIDPRDFADLRDGGFDLDGIANRWLRGVIQRQAIADASPLVFKR